MTASAPPAGPSEAYAIWQHARSAVTNAEYPRHLAYTIAITGLDGQNPVTEHYRAAYDSNGDGVRVFPISNEELAAPAPVPHGVNFEFSIGLCWGHNGGCGSIQVPVGHPAPYEDLIGVPLLTPTYMFGIGYHTPVLNGSTDDGSRLRVIATVSSQSPEYRVSLVGEPTVDGVPTYHLALQPLRRPKDNRLRELWVGTADHLPRRATVAGNFTMAPLVDVPWSIDFSVAGGAPYVSRESTPVTLYLAHHRVVRNAVVAFDDVHEPAGLYDIPLIAPETTETSLVEP